jgi:hypothetical protein
VDLELSSYGHDLEDFVLQLRKEQLPPMVCAAVEEDEVRAVVRGTVAKELGIDSALAIALP